jgi:hypothetical protein
VIITGCDTKSTTYAGETPAALQRLVLAANRVTSNTARLAGGSVDLAAVDSTGAIVPRLTARFDGPVAIHRMSSSAGANLRMLSNTDTSAINLTVSGNHLLLQGDSATNPNPHFIFGGNGMTAPLTMRLRRVSAAPVAADQVSVLEMLGRNSAASDTIYARIVGVSDAVAAGSEAGAISFETRQGATLAQRMRIGPDGAVSIGGPLTLAGDPAAALEAAPRQYVDAQFTARRAETVPTAAATPLTHAAHNARTVIGNTGTTLSIDWAASGAGFRCTVVNRTAANLPIAMTGFTGTTPAHPDGHTRIRAGGLAELFAYSPDGGTTRVLHLSGQTAA